MTDAFRMRSFRRSIAAALLFANLAAAASSQTPLDKYLAGMKTLRSEFTQTVTDGRGEQMQQANGKLVIVRPGRFRWELTPAGNPNAQLMIADGRNLWFYDPDLEQVSVKPATVLTATPASLLSGAGDIRALFTVSAAGKRDGFDWVKVVPKQADADFRDAQLGFGNSELRRMVLKDKLGQTVRLDFVASERNAPVADAEVTFAPPPGADVIGTPIP
jgi:outer membrane lipoprotein carrier protein